MWMDAAKGRKAGAPIVTPGYFYIYLFGGVRQIANFVHSRRQAPDFRLSQSSPASRLHEFIRYYSIMLRRSRSRV